MIRKSSFIEMLSTALCIYRVKLNDNAYLTWQGLAKDRFLSNNANNFESSTIVSIYCHLMKKLHTQLFIFKYTFLKKLFLFSISKKRLFGSFLCSVTTKRECIKILKRRHLVFCIVIYPWVQWNYAVNTNSFH